MKKRGWVQWGAWISGTAFFLLGCGGGGTKKVYFGNLEDGANVESPFKVQMKVENLIVEPATLGVTEGHGHFHIIVDGLLASPSQPMVKDGQHIHYGGGETEAIVDLPVGQHTLILQFATGDHVPLDPPVYQQIQINVTKQNTVDTLKAKPDSAVADTTVDSLKALVDTTVTDKTDAPKQPDSAINKP